MNYIFDIGNVLVSYKPVPFLKSLFTDDLLVDRLYKTIYCSAEWVYMDLGFLARVDAAEKLCTREPELEKEIRRVMENLDCMFTPLDGTVELLPGLLESGNRLFLLSNIHSEIRDYLLREHRFFDMFSGGVFSCDVNILKPSPDIYRLLLDNFSLSAGECVFFDDFKDNVEAAIKVGIKSVLFSGAHCITGYAAK